MNLRGDLMNDNLTHRYKFIGSTKFKNTETVNNLFKMSEF